MLWISSILACTRTPFISGAQGFAGTPRSTSMTAPIGMTTDSCAEVAQRFVSAARSKRRP